MFVRIKHVQSGGRSYNYLQIVENHRIGTKVRQRLVATLGRLEDMQTSGSLDGLIDGLIKHSAKLRLLEAREKKPADAFEIESDRVWGPILVFDRLWEELGLKAHLKEIAARRKLGFDFERMVFAQVLQRLLEPGSDLRGSKWIHTVQEPAFHQLRLEHFYRCLGLLWRKKGEIEEGLYRRGLDLFNQEMDLVFFDTTSTYFEGTDLEGWAKLGKSKDHRPDHLQLVLSVVMRPNGFPIACEIWPGNTADVTTLQPVVRDLKQRFRIRRVVFVCDRGMVSKDNLAAFDQAGFPYIVGVKMRRAPEVRDGVLGSAGQFAVVDDNLHVKEVSIEGRRYVICFNPEEAEKDRHDREALIEKVQAKLARGGVKALLNNRGYKRFLRVADNSALLDPDAIAEDARYDGKYVLRTTTDLPAAEVAEAYKQLTWVERLWRELKSVLRLRPVFHHWKRINVKGHMFVCFLALYLVALLKQRLREKDLELPWDNVIRDLSQLRAVVLRFEGQRFLMRSPLNGCAGHVLQAVGVRPPALAEAL
jgi:hypothetical protein